MPRAITIFAKSLCQKELGTRHFHCTPPQQLIPRNVCSSGDDLLMVLPDVACFLQDEPATLQKRSPCAGLEYGLKGTHSKTYATQVAFGCLTRLVCVDGTARLFPEVLLDERYEVRISRHGCGTRSKQAPFRQNKTWHCQITRQLTRHRKALKSL